MSDDYYWTRLRFHHGAGVAKLRGVTVKLMGPPDLGRGPVHEVDYAPEAGCREVRRRACDARTDMEPDEIAAADALLRRLTLDAAGR